MDRDRQNPATVDVGVVDVVIAEGGVGDQVDDLAEARESRQETAGDLVRFLAWSGYGGVRR